MTRWLVMLGFTGFFAVRSLATPVTELCKDVLVTQSHKVQTSQEEDLEQKLNLLRQQIQESHENIYFRKLLNRYGDFEKIQASEEEWHRQAQCLQAFHWPAQNTWKQVVGGHLFYPPQIEEWYETPSKRGCLSRSDMVWALAIASKYKHTIASSFLVIVLEHLRSAYTEHPLPDFFLKLYQKAQEELTQNLDHPYARYLVGRRSSTFCRLIKGNPIDYDHAYKIHEAGKDLRNRFQALILREHGGKAKATSDDYLALAAEGYGPAYLYGAQEAGTEKEETILQTIKTSYPLAYMELGDLYYDKKERDLALHYYEEAGKNGVSNGYIEVGKLLLKGANLKKRELKTLTQQEIDQVLDYFAKAGAANNPEGWDWLAKISLEYYKISREPHYLEQATGALNSGIRLGSPKAYHQTFMYFRSAFDEVVKYYGPPPQEKLYLFIENFLDHLNVK